MSGDDEVVVLSFDVGIRHLSYAFVNDAKQLLHWALVDLKTTSVWQSVARLYAHLETLWQTWSGVVTHVVLETQMAPKMKSIFHALQMYFLCKHVPAERIVAFSAAHKLTVDDTLLDGESELTAAEVRVWARILKRRDAYGIRKDIGILHTLRLITNMTAEKERWMRELLAWYDDDKADDVADAFLQAVAFLERRAQKQKQRASAAAEKKGGAAAKRVGRIYAASRGRSNK